MSINLTYPNLKDLNVETLYKSIDNLITNKQRRSLLQKLSIKNLFLCGRFAEWEYFNMDIAIESAMKVCNNAIT